MQAESTATAPRLPIVVDRTSSTNGVCLHLEVPANLTWFNGHFPSDPILPGVAQIGWAIAFARERFGLNTDPSAIERVKFLHTARPGERLTLELTRDKMHILWQFRDEDTLLSRGHLIFAAS